MKPHIERAVKEKEELDEKRVKLNIFLTSDDYADLPNRQRLLLVKQANCMETYSDILGKRIELMKSEAE